MRNLTLLETLGEAETVTGGAGVTESVLGCIVLTGCASSQSGLVAAANSEPSAEPTTAAAAAAVSGRSYNQP